MKSVNDTQKLRILVSAFSVPLIIMLIVYIIMGVYPFGERTLLIWDMDRQYVSFFSNMKQTLFEGGSPFYTFSKNLGGDMIGLSSYYLLSPLNFIMLFFRLGNFPIAIMLLTLIKIGLSGLTMSIFLNRQSYKKSSIAFSCAYALMAYNIVYQQHIMWLDGVILLPLVILGIEKIVNENSSFLYIISLAASIITNFYIGFMISIASVLYFIVYLLLLRDEASTMPKGKRLCKPVFIFSISSIIAGALSAFVVLPTLHSLLGGKTTFSLTGLTFSSNFPLFDIFSKLFNGSYSQEQLMTDAHMGLPNIYAGMFIIVFFVLFFTNGTMRMRAKVGYGIILLTMLASFHLYDINLVWHGFNEPTWFPFRYSFVFSFFLISTAHKGYAVARDSFTIKTLAAIFFSFFMLAMYVEKLQYPHLGIGNIYLSIFFLAVMLILIGFSTLRPSDSSGKMKILGIKLNRKALCIVAACVCVVDLCANAYLSLNWMGYASYNDYSDFVRVNEPIINQIKKDDPSFFRMEKTYRYSYNDSMMFAYNGLSHYSSTVKTFVRDFMSAMGFSPYDIWTFYSDGSTISVDSLLGVKYLLTREPTAKPYNLINQENDVYVYSNPYALPLGFMVNENALGVPLDEENLFELQNNIWESMISEHRERLFFPANIAGITTSNLAVEEHQDYIRYIRKEAGKDAYVEFHVNAASNYPLYAFFPAKQLRQVDVFLNDEAKGVYLNYFKHDILSLGNYETGEPLVLRMELSASDLFINAPLFYHQDMDVFENNYSELSASSFRISSFTGSRIEGEITNQGDKHYALFTIPYEEEWEIRVNGVRTPAIRVFNTLLAVEIPEGTHSITLRYVPGNLSLGVGITLLTCAGLLIRFHIRKIRTKIAPALTIQ